MNEAILGFGDEANSDHTQPNNWKNTGHSGQCASQVKSIVGRRRPSNVVSCCFYFRKRASLLTSPNILSAIWPLTK